MSTYNSEQVKTEIQDLKHPKMKHFDKNLIKHMLDQYNESYNMF